MEVRKLLSAEIENAAALVWAVFLAYEAPDYSVEGVNTFMKCINDKAFLNTLVFYGAFEESLLLGIIATRNEGNHIALFFVDGKYHRQGIGKKLFAAVLRDSPAQHITVNSSPYAVSIYRKLGFADTDTEQITDGIRYIPMIYTKGKAKTSFD